MAESSEQPLNGPTSTATLSRLARKFGESSVDGVFFRGATGSLVVKVGAAVVGLGSQVALAKLLGAEVFGQYVFVVSWVMLLLTFAIVGFDVASVRFVASYHGQSEFGKLRGFLRRSNQFVLLASLLTAASMALVSWLFSSLMSTSLFHTFLIGAILLPLVALLHLCAFQLRGLKKIVQGEGPLNVLRPLLIAVAVVMLVFVVRAERLYASNVMLINVAVTLPLLLLTVFLLGRAVPNASQHTGVEYNTRQWLGTAGSMFLLSSLAHMHARIDVMMVGILVNTTDAGVYKVAVDLAALVTFGLMSVNIIAGPMISELHTQARSAELQRVVRFAAFGGCAVAVVAVPMLLFGGKWILGFFGAEFTRAYPALAIICVGQIASVISGPVGWILNMTGHHRQAVAITTVSLVTNVLLNVMLIPRFGIVGAAMATAVTATFQNLMMFLCVKKRLKIDPSLLLTFASWRTSSP